MRQREKPAYRYYAVRRPADIGACPKVSVSIRNYDADGRVLAENGLYLAWGELVCDRPLSWEQMDACELEPARDNPDIRAQMDEQAQYVGKWEEQARIPDAKRLTWWYPDFGSYVVNDWVTPRKLRERYLRLWETGGKAEP